MRQMTEENLKAAFAGESQAHMKYKAFSKKAEREGYPNIARLFQAISFAEQVHATNHFRILGNLNGTSENLQAAIDGETYEIEEMYPSFILIAEEEEEQAAARTETWALEAEKIHAQLYDGAKEAVDEGEDMELETINICSTCGWTGLGEAPDVCPVCGAKKEFFEQF